MGQQSQSQDSNKDIRPSNNDVAGLSGGIKDPGSRSTNEGYSCICKLINIYVASRKVATAMYCILMANYSHSPLNVWKILGSLQYS